MLCVFICSGFFDEGGGGMSRKRALGCKKVSLRRLVAKAFASSGLKHVTVARHSKRREKVEHND